MEKNHTPGPWRAEPGVHPNNWIVLYDYGPLAIVRLEDGDPFDGTNEGNAKLMATAPALLAACEAFVDAWKHSHQLEKTDVALRLAEAAIAAAKGEQAERD